MPPSSPSRPNSCQGANLRISWSFRTGRSLCYCASRVRGTMTETRKIAAILAADVVGFSRMTSADEDGTLARLRALRTDLIDPTVATHNGRVFKRTGDGALIEFRSVVDAVRCAIAVQNSMVERFSGVPPDRRNLTEVFPSLGAYHVGFWRCAFGASASCKRTPMTGTTSSICPPEVRGLSWRRRV